MAIVIFSIMAPLGVAIGLLITNFGNGSTIDSPIAVLEAIATGTFLYVTFMELVPHEFVGNVRHGPQKVAMMICGFAVMAIMQAFAHDHGAHEGDEEDDHDHDDH